MNPVPTINRQLGNLSVVHTYDSQGLVQQRQTDTAYWAGLAAFDRSRSTGPCGGRSRGRRAAGCAGTAL